MPKLDKYDCIIIGGGFFGAYIALQLKEKYNSILVLEQESDLLLHASLNNQARVHNGYHYPRSLSTAISSRRHFKTFCNEFKTAIKNDFAKYYAIANIGSKTSSTQFYRLFKQFDIFIESVPNHIKAMFNKKLVSDVFLTREYAFDAAILREILKERLESKKIEIATNTQAVCVREDKVGLCVEIQKIGHSACNAISADSKAKESQADSGNAESMSLDSNTSNAPAEVSWSDFSGFGAKGEGSLLKANDRALSEQSAKSAQETMRETQKLHASLILNCTYAGINHLLQNSHLPPLPLKFEMTEMALVNVPVSLQDISVTIMDGAFFSLMPYPSKDCYTLSHVRYTPHFAWRDFSLESKLKAYNLQDSNNPLTQATSPYTILQTFKQNATSNFPLMKADARRYMPILESLEYLDSLYEIKTLQIQNEIDDGRPIIFAKDYGLKGFCTIMGGKIDNIYEIAELLDMEL
ncbi:FAD-dependent oxidoreductase [Helicobacter bilis]|uniref:FAD-dependent oxidoreductase n=1 Tax=Helicobacter bilis TaxID=37372 RepID=A0A1Q2LGT5_9HELI|nr:FAD-dependent oxidoreductase [Helicobacter bilis]AQQ59162.1 FAD-dependent oxidoreductase [Helicobacter bilis]